MQNVGVSVGFMGSLSFCNKGALDTWGLQVTRFSKNDERGATTEAV